MLDELLFVLFDFLSPIEVIEMNIICSSWYKLVDEYFTKIFSKKIQQKYPTIYNETIHWKNKILFLKNKNLPNYNFNSKIFDKMKSCRNKSAFINLKFRFQRENQVYQEKFFCKVSFDDDDASYLEHVVTFFYNPQVEKEDKEREMIRKKIHQELKFFEEFNLLNGNRLLDIIPVLDAFENNYDFECGDPTFEKLTEEEFIKKHNILEFQNVKDLNRRPPKEDISFEYKHSYLVHSDETREVNKTPKVIIFFYRTLELKLGEKGWTICSKIEIGKIYQEELIEMNNSTE
jgi:hypothetical protein